MKLEWKQLKGDPRFRRAKAGRAHFIIGKIKSYAGTTRYRLSIFNPGLGGSCLINHSKQEKVEEYAQNLVDAIRGADN